MNIINNAISLEVCANSITSALAAQDGGALRVELCDNLFEGGTTPSAGQISMAKKLLHIKLYVLIRPRSGDFLYDDVEFETMLADIKFCAEVGCDGIVTGILKADGTVDKDRNAQLVNVAKAANMALTFHRAFDMCADPYQAMEEIIELGFERVLTSGGKSTAMEGASTIARLVKKAAGRIIIMPGSGIDEHNVADLVRFTGVKEFHSSARKMTSSKMTYQNDHIIMGGTAHDEYSFDKTDTERVKTLIALANNQAS
jgi:copper homeostasis protein